MLALLTEPLVLIVLFVRRRESNGWNLRLKNQLHAHLSKLPATPPPHSLCLAPGLRPLLLPHQPHPARLPLRQPLFPPLHRWESDFPVVAAATWAQLSSWWWDLLRIEGKWGSELTGFGSIPHLCHSFFLLSLSHFTPTPPPMLLSHQKSRIFTPTPMSVKIMRSEGLTGRVLKLSKWVYVLPILKMFFLFLFRSPVNSATPKCVKGHPKTLPLHPLPRPPRPPLALRRASHYVNCAWTRPRSRAPAAVLETSTREATTGRGDGNARRAGHRVNVTLKATTAAMVPGAPGASSSGTIGVLHHPDAAPRREDTGTLEKSRTSHQYRQNKNLISIEKDVWIYTWIYIII